MHEDLCKVLNSVAILHPPTTHTRLLSLTMAQHNRLGKGIFLALVTKSATWSGEVDAFGLGMLPRVSSTSRSTTTMGMGNSLGRLFRISTWGESHGGGVGVNLDGCPPKIPLSAEDIQVGWCHALCIGG